MEQGILITFHSFTVANSNWNPMARMRYNRTTEIIIACHHQARRWKMKTAVDAPKITVLPPNSKWDLWPSVQSVSAGSPTGTCRMILSKIPSTWCNHQSWSKVSSLWTRRNWPKKQTLLIDKNHLWQSTCRKMKHLKRRKRVRICPFRLFVTNTNYRLFHSNVGTKLIFQQSGQLMKNPTI